MGESLGQTLAGKNTPYQPGVWFNSAKFFDIEYQTYGKVSSQLLENEDHFYWEADDGKKCVKIVFERESQEVIGVNTLGIRMRHEIWDKWILEKKTLQEVVANLRKANFDPEFFKQFEPEIQALYNEKFPGPTVELHKPSLLSRIFS